MFPDSETISVKNCTQRLIVNVGKSITGQRLTSVVIDALKAQLRKLGLVEKSCLFSSSIRGLERSFTKDIEPNLS